VSQEGLDAYRSGHRQEHSERCKNAELSELGIIPILCARGERKRLRLSMNTAFEPTYDTDYLYADDITFPWRRVTSPDMDWDAEMYRTHMGSKYHHDTEDRQSSSELCFYRDCAL
jgi:hypothetical protein